MSSRIPTLEEAIAAYITHKVSPKLGKQFQSLTGAKELPSDVSSVRLVLKIRSMVSPQRLTFYHGYYECGITYIFSNHGAERSRKSI